MANRVQIALPEEDHAALSKLADEEDRTIAGQARHMLRKTIAFQRMIQDGRVRLPLDALRDPQSLQGEQQPETHNVTGNAGPELVSFGRGGLNSTVCPSCAARAGTPHLNTCPLAGGIPVDNSHD